MNYSDIADYVTQGLTDAEIAAELTDNPPAHWFRNLNSRDVLAWLGGDGRMVAIEEAAGNTSLPDNLRGAIKATLIVIQRTDTAIDIRPGADHYALLMGCVQAGVFELADVQALIDACRLIETPTVEDVTAVRNHHETTQRITSAYEAAIVSRDNGEDAATVKAAMIGGWDGNTI